MKKVTTITALLAILIASCSKTSPDLRRQSPATSALPSTTPTQVNFVSNWITPGIFSVDVDRLNRCFITGSFSVTGQTQVHYDKATHMELAYVRIPNHGISNQYKRLAIGLGVEANGITSHVLIDYLLETDGLKIVFKNAEQSALLFAVDRTVSENWNYRYLIIPKSKYQVMNIDWDDLAGVASALNFSL